MSWWCHVSNFRSVRCQECHQRHPYPPSPELDPWSTVGSWPTFWLYVMAWKCRVSNFMSLGCQETKTPLSSISRVGSLEDRWFLTNFLDVGYVLEMWGFKFWVSRISGRSSKTPLSSISRVGSLEKRWLLTHIMDVGYVQEMSCFKYQVSFFDVRRVIKDTPIFHLQSWIFGGQVVPNPLSECRLCPSDVMFQISGL